MKKPISWHQERLRNRQRYLEQEKNRMAILAASIERRSQEIRHLEAQIEAATKQGKDGFDADKFLFKKGS